MNPRSIRTGVLAGAGLMLFYIVVVAGASGSWAHLTDQARQDWYYLVLIVGGFGTQIALMSELRRRHRLHHGAADLEIAPRQLDDAGAVFAITLDTHSVELSMDPTAAELDVGGIAWPVTGWDGDGPSGHHRKGELRFDAAGSATGTARLVLAGFPEPVAVSWELNR